MELEFTYYRIFFIYSPLPNTTKFQLQVKTRNLKKYVPKQLKIIHVRHTIYDKQATEKFVDTFHPPNTDNFSSARVFAVLETFQILKMSSLRIK